MVSPQKERHFVERLELAKLSKKTILLVFTYFVEEKLDLALTEMFCHQDSFVSFGKNVEMFSR